MITTKIKHVASFANLCVANGIKTVVISPGSRNAPLVTAFESHPAIKTYLVHDERVAAFMALGMAETFGEPVIITCTSGSAPLNYAGAIVEAYYRQIPLFVVTADRPPELIDQGDGQTIRQRNVFANYIKDSFELPASPNEIERSNQIAREAIQSLISIPTGPVHLNVPLYEPLYEREEFNDQNSDVQVEPLVANNWSKQDLKEIEEIWKNSQKVLIIIGQNPNDGLLESLAPLLERPEVAVLVENTSNLVHFGKIVHSIDRTLAKIEDSELVMYSPDLIISTGGAIISKRIKRYLRDFSPAHNWRVGQYLIKEDTYQSLTKMIVSPPKTLFNFLAGIDKVVDSNYGNKWKQKDLMAQVGHEGFLSQETDFSDLKVFELLLDYLPENSNLHMGNSSVVRYCQLFNPIKSIRYFSNRGVSGIDGSLSTAVGCAIKTPNKLNTVILGDISFVYDSNGLWINELPSNLRIIVVNNGGGGIFKILPDARNSEHKDRFYAPHNPKIAGICEAFNVVHKVANSLNELEEAMLSFYHIPEHDRPILLEVNTSEIESQLVLDRYFKFIADN